MSFHHWAALLSSWACGLWFSEWWVTDNKYDVFPLVILLGVATVANIRICIAKYGYLGGWK